MKNTKPIQKTPIQKANELLKLFNNEFYWLAVMVKQRMINEGQAGYIITTNEGIT